MSNAVRSVDGTVQFVHSKYSVLVEAWSPFFGECRALPSLVNDHMMGTVLLLIYSQFCIAPSRTIPIPFLLSAQAVDRTPLWLCSKLKCVY